MPYIKRKGYVKTGKGMMGMKPSWTHQNNLNNDPTYRMPSSEETKQMILNIKEERVRVLALLLYLTAGRLTEILKLVPANFGDRYTRKDEKDIKILLIQMKNLKNRKEKVKQIPLSYEKYKEEIEVLRRYVNKFERFQLLFEGCDVGYPLSRSRAYTLVKEVTGYNPHWFRHLRLTHKCHEDNWSDQLLKRMAGWTDTRNAAVYVRTRWVDLV